MSTRTRIVFSTRKTNRREVRAGRFPETRFRRIAKSHDNNDETTHTTTTAASARRPRPRHPARALPRDVRSTAERVEPLQERRDEGGEEEHARRVRAGGPRRGLREVEETLPGGEGGVEDEAHPRGRGRRVSGTRGEATTGARRCERAIRHGHATGDGRRRERRRETRSRAGGGGHERERLRKREKRANINPPAPAPARLPHRASHFLPPRAFRRPLRRHSNDARADDPPTMDPLAPSITFYDKESGKGRVTYLGAVPRPHLSRARARTLSPPRSIRPSASDLTRDTRARPPPHPSPLAARRKPHPRVPLLPHPRVMVHEPGPRGARGAPRSRRAPPSPARATAPRLGIPDPRTAHPRPPRPSVPRS